MVTGLRTYPGDVSSGPALYWTNFLGQNMATVNGTSGGAMDLDLDASKSSSLYQDNLTEVRVNALLGLNLIKAF